MKKYHLTILRNAVYTTIIGEMSSIVTFLLIEKEVGNDTHILYSRELSDDEYKIFKSNR